MASDLKDIKKRMEEASLPSTHNMGNPETQRLFQANRDRRWLVERLEGAVRLLGAVDFYQTPNVGIRSFLRRIEIGDDDGKRQDRGTDG